MEDEILVSVYCLAYNHEKYIRDALDGFVSQKTKFRYEVIIHDDASTDETASIIKEYQEKYPQIIKPIFQAENQYSKGIDIFDTYIYEKIRGKYIAVCEGDDYWISEDKLQKQVEILEKNPEYSACTHCVEEVDVRNNTKYIFNSTNEDYIFDISDLLKWTDKRYLSSSLVAKKNLFTIPDEIKMERVGDYPRAVYMAMNGPVYYMKEVKSVYRYYTPGSWSSKNESDRNKIIKNINGRIDFLRRFNVFSNGKYQDEVNQAINYNEIEIRLMTKEYKELFEFLSKTKDKHLRTRVYANVFFPHICKLRKKILKVIKNKKYA